MNLVPALLVLGLVAPCGPHASVVADSTWFMQTLSLDVTADGVPDSLLLRAFGSRVDSLCVEFTIVVHDTPKFREFWLTDWYFAYAGPVDEMDPVTVRARVEEEITTFFDRDRFSPLDTTSAAWGVPLADGSEPREHILWYYTFERTRDSMLAVGADRASANTMAQRQAWDGPHDSASVSMIWDDMRAHPPLAFTFFSGGEHIRTIAWSRLQQRFFVVFACC